MKRSVRCATIVAVAVLCSNGAPRAQEQAGAPEEQTALQQEQTVAPAQDQAAAAPQEQAVETPQRIVAEEPAAPIEQPVETPQRVVAPEEPAAPEATPVDAVAAEEPVAEEPTEPAEEPIIEESKDVRFVIVSDALPTRFFDAATTAPDAADPNTLVIGLHTDTDRATWKVNNFRASTAAFNHLAAIDTITFRIEAPRGRRIAKVIYRQAGTGSAIRVAKASGVTQWVVGDYAAQIGVFGTNPTLTGEADFGDTPRESVDVSITTGLFVFAAPTSGAASLEVTSAEVQVVLVDATDGL
jgi:outer membrane biosynthesis protein TonB